MSEPNGRGTPIDLDRLGVQLVGHAGALAAKGELASAGVLMLAHRAIAVLLAEREAAAPAKAPAPEVTEGA